MSKLPQSSAERLRSSSTRPKDHAARHQAVREAHARETAEDYVEAIDDLIRDRGRARVVDLASRFGVSHVTVVRIIERLEREGLVRTEPYRPIGLTKAGAKLASRSRDRHRVLLEFLLAVGVPAAAAARDAEGMEHHVSSATLRAFRAFVSSP